MRISNIFKTAKRRVILYVALGLLTLYVCSYLPKSYYGGYYFSQSGKSRYATGMSVSDIVIWHPGGLWYQYPFINIHGNRTSRGNLQGYFYAPLILLDRAFWHKAYTVQEFEDRFTNKRL